MAKAAKAAKHKALGERLRIAREGDDPPRTRKFSKSKAAREIGIDYKQLHQYERGVVEPKTGRIQQLAALYGVSASTLIGTQKYPRAFLRFVKRFKVEDLTPSEMDWLASAPIPESEREPVMRYASYYNVMRSGEGFSALEEDVTS